MKKKINKLSYICKKNSQEVKNGIGISHYDCFKKIIDKFHLKKAQPLRAIDTIETLKLINMLYLSAFKKIGLKTKGITYLRGWEIEN